LESGSGTPPMADFGKLIEGIERRLQNDFEFVTQQYGYPLEKGIAREELILGFLRKYMPSQFHYGPGIVFTAEGKMSLPQDIVIFDHLNYPMFPLSEVSKLFPVEGVKGLIQVKSLLKANEIANVSQNLASAKNLFASVGQRAIGTLVAFKSEENKVGIRDALERDNILAIAPYLAIDRIYLIGEYVITYLNQQGVPELRAQQGEQLIGIETKLATLLHLYRHLVAALLLPSGTSDDFRHYLDAQLNHKNFPTF
jgi:hypothetical protein